MAFSVLPTSYQNAIYPQAAGDVAQILNTLSLYPLAVDGKDFDALSLVFTADVYTNFSAPLNVLTPLTVVKQALNQSLAPVTSQHSYGTQIVEILSECQAKSLSYFTASQFGKGVYYGQVRFRIQSSIVSTYFRKAKEFSSGQSLTRRIPYD